MNNIKFYRVNLNMTIQELAGLSNVVPSYICGLEKGRKSNPSREVMERISKALDRTVPEVFFPVEKAAI